VLDWSAWEELVLSERDYAEESLLGIRAAATYNRAEREYSALLYRRIEQLLKGQRS